MTEQIAVTALVRRLLAVALAPPSGPSVAEASDLAAALADLPAAPPAVRLLADVLAVADPTTLAAEHTRLFDGEVLVPPYEGSYELDPFRQGRQMADVAGFYAAYGADARGPDAERADHAGVELEFLAYLALLRLDAIQAGDEPRATLVAETEEEFLREHAGRWLPLFFDRIADESADPVYAGLGLVGRDAIVADLTARGIVVDPVPTDRRPRTAVEDDELTCAAAGPEDVGIITGGRP